MKRLSVLIAACIILSSHDMYLKMDTYFLDPGVSSQVLLYNGTFEKSDNVITRDRMTDVSLVGNGTRTRIDTTQWTDEGETTILNFDSGEAGTWVAGVSTRARNIEMDAQAFNDYLEHDGVLDMLKQRKENNTFDQAAIEKYSKHVKAIFQVGDKLTNDWKTALGYPIEFVPLGNPYDLHPGHALEIELLWQGKPLPDQLVYVGSKYKGGHTHEDHSHDHGQEAHSHGDDSGHTHDKDDHGHDHGDDGHSHDNDSEGHSHDHEEAEEHADDHTHDMTQYRTDENGRVALNIEHEGIWYLRTIHLVESAEEGLTHESNWATLTFEIGSGHSHEHVHAHDEEVHSHDDEGGIPGWAYGLGSLALVAILFFIFNRQQK